MIRGVRVLNNLFRSLPNRLFFHQQSNRRTALISNRTNLAKMPQPVPSIEIHPSSYPQVERGDVVDDYHGVKVFDPYRALEEPDAEITKKFVSDLNSISLPFLSKCYCRDELRERLTALWDFEKYSCTSIRGDFFYYYYNGGLQNHSVLYQQKSLDEKGEIFLDPNSWSEDGTTALTQTSWTEDGQILAYGICEKGSDWTTIKFKKCTGEELPDTIPGVKFSGCTWLHDNSGVFYSKYPNHKFETTGKMTDKHEYHSIYFHRLGTDSNDDFLVFDRRDDPNWMLGADISDDGKYLFVHMNKGCEPTNQIFYFDLEEVQNRIDGRLEMLPLFNKGDANYDVIDSDENSALILTNHNAPMFKLVRIKLGPAAETNQNDNWEVIIDEEPNKKLSWVAPVHGDKMIVCYVEDVKNTLFVHSLKDGKRLYQIPLEIGIVSGVYARKKESRFFLSFESFFTPTIIWKGDFAKCASISTPIELSELRKVTIKGVEASDFEAEQLFYESKDGTKVPMYVLHSKSLVLNGQNGAVLYGYGGFNVPQMPYFSVSRLLFLQKFGGVYAIANIRGGSEYGEKWHEAGMRELKQNVFDDFICAAEHLVNKKYTSPSKLAIHGGSNGGLLTAVCAQQRPELFGAVIAAVGVLDMLRFHKFTIGAAWVPELGNPDICEDFKFIYPYSPLHQLSVRQGVQWPAMLLMSADHDDRVVPLHTLKYLAQLYYLLDSEAAEWQRKPVLGRIDVKAGHGAGKPTSKLIDDLVDTYSFLQRVLDLKWN